MITRPLISGRICEFQSLLCDGQFLNTHENLPAGGAGTGAKQEEHQATEDADEFERDVEGGKEKVSWSQKREFHTRQTEKGLEAVSIQVGDIT